ncbi:MAG: YbgA family protein [FCB group bacterium]|nr:YbgA family protein [FCB group bacterium]
MARHQTILKEMDRFVKRHSGGAETVERYQRRLAVLLKKRPRLQNQYQILRDYVDQIASAFTSTVRRRIYQDLDEYRMGRGSLTTMREWFASYEGNSKEATAQFHRLFEPYPRGLIPRDSV